ncbi:MAG TPA: hypothetical protein PKA60_01655 [Candidatus Paceibacterota bacterium]|nr:hypothetical protein [Candidatus Paceibacterota bacterium]
MALIFSNIFDTITGDVLKALIKAPTLHHYSIILPSYFHHSVIAQW